jgi:hypothetical protein
VSNGEVSSTWRNPDQPLMADRPRCWMRCDAGHVFSEQHAVFCERGGHVRVSCPSCSSEKLKCVEPEVVFSIRNRFANEDVSPDRIMARMEWDTVNGCYMFPWAGMLIGVETDGYIHS